MYQEAVKELYASRNTQKGEEFRMFKQVAKEFMTKFGTNKAFFDYSNGDAPAWEFIGYADSDIKDAYITSITFREDGSVWLITAYLYYECENVEAVTSDFVDVDYLELAEFLDTQIDTGQVKLDEDEI